MSDTKHHQWVFRALCLFLLLPNILGFILAKDLPEAADKCIYLIGSMLLYAVGLACFKKRTFLYVASLGLFFSAVEIVHLIINQATTSLLFVFTIIKSEKGEFFELLSMYWWVVVFFFALWGVYFFLAKRYVENEWIASQKVRESLILTFACFAFLGGYTMSGGVKTAPVNMLYNVYRIVKMDRHIRQNLPTVEAFRFGVEKATNDAESLVVLVIGETSRYDHWQLNGYERETSPRLMARQNEIISFDSCYAIANLTTVSVPLMLSPATPTTLSSYTQQRSVVEAFEEAGYRTSWLADQSFNNHFLQRISATCDTAVYIHDDGETLFADYLLVAPFEQQLAYAGRQLVVLHSLGCHFKYSERYPEGFGPYQPDMRQMQKVEGQSLLETAKTLLVNSYDNAIRYTDFFLDSLIQVIEKSNRPAVLVYLGDHGENLLDDERNMFLHGTYSGSKYEYHVPLFVWTSEAYRQAHEDKIAAMQGNKKKVMTTMTLFDSLLDLGDIAYSQLDSTQVISSAAMQADSLLYGLDANLNPFRLGRMIRP